MPSKASPVKIPLSLFVQNPAIFAVAARNIEQWLDYWFDRQSLTPGMTLCIRHGDQTLLNKSWGVADAATGEKLSLKHAFRLASQTKMLTADAVFLLQQEGKLNIKDTLGQHLPWLDQKSHLASVTLADVLAHRAGIQREGGDARHWAYETEFPSAKKFKTITNKLPALDKADVADVKYSNWGYALLGQVIEAASGVPYKEFITNRLLQPLGLKNTSVDAAPGMRLTKGHGKQVRGDYPVFDPSASTGALSPATGLAGTPLDMCTYLLKQTQAETTLLNKKSQRELSRHFCFVASTHQDYGMGRLRYSDFKPLTFIGHSGAFMGQRSYSYVEPELGLAISLAGNGDGLGETYVIESCLEAIKKHVLRPDMFLHPSSLNGRYQSLRSTQDVFKDEENLFMADPSRDDYWQSFAALTKKPGGVYHVDKETDPSMSGEPVYFTGSADKKTMHFAGHHYKKVLDKKPTAKK